MGVELPYHIMLGLRQCKSEKVQNGTKAQISHKQVVDICGQKEREKECVKINPITDLVDVQIGKRNPRSLCQTDHHNLEDFNMTRTVSGSFYEVQVNKTKQWLELARRKVEEKQKRTGNIHFFCWLAA